MRRHRNNSILLLVTLLLALFAPEEVECARLVLAHRAAQMLQIHCVYALCPTEEMECRAPARTASGTEACSADRSDDLTEVFYPACLTEGSGRPSLVVPLVLSFAGVPDRETPVLAEVIAYPLESRGPPFSSISLCPPSLRAPPIA